MVTVTMPIKEYEQMKNDIERLKKESIYNHAEKEYINMERNEFEITLDVTSIKKVISEKEYKSFEMKIK